jgi:Zn-dependent protease
MPANKSSHNSDTENTADISLGNIQGIQINIDYSWILIFLLVVINLTFNYFPLYLRNSQLLNIVLGIFSALLLTFSVILHEIAHCWVAKNFGLPVDNITLFALGGISNIKKEPDTPINDFIITIVGPLSNLILGLLFFMIEQLVRYTFTGADLTEYFSTQNYNTTLLVLTWISNTNILLGLFNLFPAYPLDGGRLLRSFIWQATRKFSQATIIVSYLGEIGGWLFISLGILIVNGFSISILANTVINGLWLLFVGWFLISSARHNRDLYMIYDVLNIKENPY